MLSPSESSISFCKDGNCDQKTLETCAVDAELRPGEKSRREFIPSGWTRGCKGREGEEGYVRICIPRTGSSHCRTAFGSTSGCEQLLRFPAKERHSVYTTAGDKMPVGGRVAGKIGYISNSSNDRSYTGVNEEIIWTCIGMSIIIAVLITMALCYIAREKCRKRNEYYISA